MDEYNQNIKTSIHTKGEILQHKIKIFQVI